MSATILKTLDDLGIANDTIVLYTTDNGPHQNSWPDGGTTPFRSEKNTNWEGAFRVPCLIRWPGRIQPGSVSNEIVSGLDWLPTLMAAAGDPDIKDKLLKGHQAGGKTFKVHLDGYNQLPYLTGQQPTSARKEFFYFNDDGDLVALRYENWKIVFEEQRAPGTLRVWAEPFTKLRVPEDLRPARGPLRAGRHHVEHLLRLVHVGRMPASCPVAGRRGASSWRPSRSSRRSQRPASFSVDQIDGEDAAELGARQHATCNGAGRRQCRPASRPTGRDRGGRHVDASRSAAAHACSSALLCGWLRGHAPLAQADPLPSWNDGAAKQAIIDFVARVTTRGRRRTSCRRAERIAIFDNDGTLWAEQPIYFQFAFALDRVKALAPQHPEWKDKQPFKAVLEGDIEGARRGRREGPARRSWPRPTPA